MRNNSPTNKRNKARNRTPFIKEVKISRMNDKIKVSFIF